MLDLVSRRSTWPVVAGGRSSGVRLEHVGCFQAHRSDLDMEANKDIMHPQYQLRRKCTFDDFTPTPRNFLLSKMPIYYDY